MDSLSYKTLSKEGVDEFIVNKSRFIGYGCPCKTEEEAIAFINRIREKHRTATHNCYAYVIGQNAGIMRYSDDGEPGGTAGMPILEVIRNRDIVDCAVVVTRYFGGVLLGAGGLVRAYTNGSKIALDASDIVIMRRSARWILEVDYSTWQRVNYYLASQPCILLDSEFGVSVVVTLMLRCDMEEAILADLTRITDGTVELLPDGTLYYPWPEEVANS